MCGKITIYAVFVSKSGIASNKLRNIYVCLQHNPYRVGGYVYPKARSSASSLLTIVDPRNVAKAKASATLHRRYVSAYLTIERLAVTLRNG